MLSVLFLLTLATPTDDPKLDRPLHIAREKACKVEVTLTETLTDFETIPPKWWV